MYETNIVNEEKIKIANQPKISMIVPVYNVEQYLERCVKSIMNQSYSNLEILLVDDGSTDKSAGICDALSLLDCRVKVIHKQNGGVSSARNVGLAVSTSEYVMFVDADDWLDSMLCESLLYASNNADFIITGYSWITKNKTEVVSMESQMYQFPIDAENMFEKLYGNHLLNAPWGKMYKRNVIGEQQFDKRIELGEDLIFNLRYLSKCSNIVYIDGGGYFYNCANDNAATKRMRENDLEQISYLYFKTLEFEEAFCKSKKTRYLVDQAYFEAGIGVVQRLFYSDSTCQEKKMVVKKMFSLNEYMKCCGKEYKVSIQYKLVQRLCRLKCYFGLWAFFSVKKEVYKMLNAWRSML